MSYNKPAIQSLVASGDQDIDGILASTRWASTSITFSFPTSYAQYHDDNGFYDGTMDAFAADFVALNTTQKNVVRAILAHISEFLPLTFTEVTEQTVGTHGTLRFGMMSTGGLGGSSTAFAYFPSTSPSGGDCWFNSSGTYNSPVKGNYAYFTFAHEIGHALGLKHGHTTGGIANIALPSDHDSIEFSVMTYRSYIGAGTSGYSQGSGSYPQTYMSLDMAALQYIYGANYSTRATDTVYSFSNTTGEMFVNGVGQGAPSANKINCCIWDGGGSDTLDLSALSPTPSPISIAPGTGSKTGSTQLPSTGGTAPTANIYVARRFDGNPASDIDGYLSGGVAALLVGAGSLSASASMSHRGAALLAGAGSLRVSTPLTASSYSTDEPTISAPALLGEAIGAALFSGAGAVVAAAGLRATLAASSYTTATPLLSSPALGEQFSAAALLAGVGGLTVDASVRRVAAASLAGVGALAGNTQTRTTGAGALAGAGGSAATAVLILPAAGALDGAGELIVDGNVRAIAAPARLDGVGSLNASAASLVPAAAKLDGVGALEADAGSVSTQGAARCDGVGSLVCDGVVIKDGAALFAGAGAVFADAHGQLVASAVFLGSGTLTSLLLLRGQIAQQLEGAGAIVVDIDQTMIEALEMDGAGTLNVAVEHIISANRLFNNVRKVVADGVAAPIMRTNARGRNVRMVSGGRA